MTPQLSAILSGRPARAVLDSAYGSNLAVRHSMRPKGDWDRLSALTRKLEQGGPDVADPDVDTEPNVYPEPEAPTTPKPFDPFSVPTPEVRPRPQNRRAEPRI
jgi:hypothetical protein